jgi:hypothetical protein
MSEIKPVRPSRRALLIGTAATLTIGAAIVVMFVLPAETGMDPTGVGKVTGLSSIAAPEANRFLERGLKRKGTFTPSQTPLPSEPGASDHWEFELKPFEGIELKYVIDEGQRVNFHWSASGPLNYDMHAHPFDGGEELTESYAITKGDRQAGRYVAAFTGIHGWYWQNRSVNSVRLTLDASGKIKGSKLFNASGEHDRTLTPPTE